jgi:sulfatase maturation enzyme AslB (radical SAM superfamily)
MVTFLNYFQTQNIILDGERLGRYNGSSLDVFGGVSLLFDKTKKLTNVTIRMVADEDIRQIKKQIEFMINAGQIEAMTTSSLPLFNKMTRKSIVSRKGKNVPIISPVLGISARNDDGELKLIRHPIHVDVIDPSARGIKEFAQIWKNVYGAK